MAASTKPLSLLTPVLATLLYLAPMARAQSSSDLDVLMTAPDLAPYQWFASTDKNHHNEDYLVLKPNETRRIPLAAGTLERLWSTAEFPDQLDLTLELGPNQRMPLLTHGDAAEGVYDQKTYFLFPPTPTDPVGHLKAGATLVVTNKSAKPNKWFYQVSVRPGAEPAIPQLPKANISFNRLPKMELAPGEEKSLTTWNSPGVVYEISVASDGGDSKIFKNLRLRAAWDGKVAVDASLLGLAGQLEGDGLVQNAVSDFDGSALVLRWPMPFKTGQMWLKNTGTSSVTLDTGVRTRGYPDEPSPYRFCAWERSATTEKDKPVDILDAEGQGAYVGLALSIKPGPDIPARTFAYLEGNETIEADGTKFEGTGNEDFFTSSWYFPDKPYYLPYQGSVYHQKMPPEIAAYRFMIPDPIPFKKSLHFTFEHGNRNNRAGMQWRWVSFWYQKSPPELPGSEPTTNPSTAAPNGASAQSSYPIWWVTVGGIIVGVVLYLSKRGLRKGK